MSRSPRPSGSSLPVWRAGGVSRTVDFVLLHRDYGIALLDAATPGEIDDSGVAVAAMRAMLEEIGFARRYPGHLGIIARRVVPDAAGDLAALLAVRFAAVAVSAIADPTWPDWLLQRLAPGDAAPGRRGPDVARPPSAAERGLRAPTPEDAWRVRTTDKARRLTPANRGEKRGAAASAEVPAMAIAAERIPVSRVAETRSPLWTGMALAVVVVAVVMVGIAVLSHGNAPEFMATQSTAPPPPATDAPAASN